MRVQIDSREQKNEHIEKYFDEQGVKHFRSKLYVGDYCDFENPSVIVERKGSLNEWAGNCGHGHDRFHNELERLDELGGVMYVVIEELDNEKNVAKYEKRNKGKAHMKWGTVKKIMATWQSKHNIRFVFVEKENSAEMIYNILKDEW